MTVARSSRLALPVAWVRRWALRGMAVLAMTGAFAVAASAARAAYTHVWTCYNWPRGSWCWDPPHSSRGPFHNWTRGEVQNLSYMWGYQCVAVSNRSGYWGAHNCANYTVYEGGTFYWNFGNAFRSHWPISGAGQQNMTNSFSTFWVSFAG